MCQSVTEPTSSTGCGCGHHAPQANVRPASHDLDFPPVPFPSSRVLASVGEAGLRRLVSRMYERLRVSTIAAMFPADEAQFAAIVEKNADFIIEHCGGPARYTQQYGHQCMRTRHFPFTIDEAARDVWLTCLRSALDDCDVPQDAARELWDWLEPMSIRMINRRTQRGQPVRYGYESGVRPAAGDSPGKSSCGCGA